MKRLFALLVFLSLSVPADAQWQVPNHSVPVGRGPGVVGFSSVTPGAAGTSFISNGASANPSFGPINLGSSGALSGVLPTVNGGTGIDNSTNSANDILASNGTNGSFIHTAFTSLLNTACTLSPATCTTLFGYTYTAWYSPACDGVTDDTVKLQNAITGTPQGGTLYIQTSAFNQGCLIKSTTTVGGVTYNLIINHPISIIGGGRYSWIKTDASIATTVVNLYFPVSSVGWDGSVFSNFQISLNGTPAIRPFTRAGANGMWFDATTAGSSGFSNLKIQNVMIGESGNAYSLLLDGASSTLNTVRDSVIWGGLRLSKVADSNLVMNNQLAGVSVFGVLIDCSAGGAATSGQCVLMANNITNAGGVVIDGGTWVGVYFNYLEELQTVNFPRNAFLDIRGISTAINGAQIYGNIIANLVSTTSLAIMIGTNGGGTVPTNTYISSNLIANTNARTAVNNFGTGTICNGINTWQTSATHVTGTGTLKNAIGSTVADCP